MKNKYLPGSKFLSDKGIIFCILSALVFITICSKSSPLYAFNDWVDANCYFTVGKSIFKGLVPYRDLFEQKGPVIYFIHDEMNNTCLVVVVGKHDWCHHVV